MSCECTADKQPSKHTPPICSSVYPPRSFLCHFLFLPSAATSYSSACFSASAVTKLSVALSLSLTERQTPKHALSIGVPLFSSLKVSEELLAEPTK
jgi:hypothetical protein